MEINGLLEKEMIHMHQNHSDESPNKEVAPAKAKAKASPPPPELTWQRKLNHSTTPLPKEYSVRFTEILHLLPLGWRLLRHIKKEADKGTPSVVDPYHKRLLTCCHGVPLGGGGFLGC